MLENTLKDEDPVSECIKRNTQELEELQKEQNKKLDNLERKNENAVATLIKDNEKNETLMRAKHFAEERAARIAVELKAVRIAFLSNKPPAPECPVCCYEMTPPKRIFQCRNGHHLCESCRTNINSDICPSCRAEIIGRAISMEYYLQNGRITI